MSIKEKRPVVFFDFDNTITTYDVMDDIIMRFSTSDEWKTLEALWREHKIGSKECLEGQVKNIRVAKDELDKYLSGVRIDPYFKRLVKLLDSNKIKSIILSDNFDYILKNILKRRGLDNIRVYSNRLGMSKDVLEPQFPFIDKECMVCGHCKKNNLLANVDNNAEVIYYIGDGLSDVCPAECADVVFAKGYLRDHFKNKGLYHIPFKELKDVYQYFEKRLK